MKNNTAIIFDYDRTLVDTSLFDGTRWDNTRDRAFIQNNLNAVSFYPKIRELLEYLKSIGVPISVVTKRHRGYIELLNSHLGLSVDMSIAVCYDDTYRGRKVQVKPSPDQFYLAKQKMFEKNIVHDNSFFITVGDDDKDIQAARNAKMFSIGVTWGQVHPFRIQPDHVCNNMSEFWRVLSKYLSMIN